MRQQTNLMLENNEKLLNRQSGHTFHKFENQVKIIMIEKMSQATTDI